MEFLLGGFGGVGEDSLARWCLDDSVFGLCCPIDACSGGDL